MKDFPVLGGPKRRIRFEITDRLGNKAGGKAGSIIDPARMSFATLRPTTSSHSTAGLSDTINSSNNSGDNLSIVWYLSSSFVSSANCSVNNRYGMSNHVLFLPSVFLYDPCNSLVLMLQL